MKRLVTVVTIPYIQRKEAKGKGVKGKLGKGKLGNFHFSLFM